MCSKRHCVQVLNLNFVLQNLQAAQEVGLFYTIFCKTKGDASFLGSKHERSRAQKRNITAQFGGNRLENNECFIQSSRNVQSLSISFEYPAGLACEEMQRVLVVAWVYHAAEMSCMLQASIACCIHVLNTI